MVVLGETDRGSVGPNGGGGRQRQMGEASDEVLMDTKGAGA